MLERRNLDPGVEPHHVHVLGLQPARRLGEAPALSLADQMVGRHTAIVEDELGRAGERAEVAQRGRQQRGRFDERAAVDEIRSTYVNCEYFPSFEITVSAATFGQFLDSDLRSISPRGVKLVTSCAVVGCCK